MKKNRTMRIGFIVLALTLVTAVLAGNTFAKYTKTVSSQDTTKVAEFTFAVKDGEGTQFTTNTQTIDIFNTVETNATGTVKEGTIAPGTYGSFMVDVDARGSEVDIDVTSEVSVTGVSVPLKFAISNVNTAPIDDSEYTVTDLKTALETAIDCTITYDNTQTKEIYIFWKWVDGQDDAIDTTLGEDAGNYMVAINVTGEQSMIARA